MILRRRKASPPECGLLRLIRLRRGHPKNPSHNPPPPGARGRLGLQSVPAHLPWPLSLRNQGKACCSSSGLPRRCPTSRVLVGIDAATERSRLFPTEGRAGMWCSPVPAPPRDTRPGPAGARRAAGGRPGARVPGQGPTVGWAQPGLPGGFFPPSNPATQPPERRAKSLSSLQFSLAITD